MEEHDEEKKIVINGKQYYNLEEVPEPFRAAIQARLDTAKTVGPDKPADGKSRIVIHKDFKFTVGRGPSGTAGTSDGSKPGQPDYDPGFQELGGSGLAAILKFLVKMAPPPPSNPRAPKPTGYATPEEKPATPADIPQPGAINPSSSGRLIWVILIGIAVFYWFYSSIK
jgi:hypothetical protein